MKKRQKRQLVEELESHIATKQMIFDMVGELVQANTAVRPKIIQNMPKVFPNSELACKPIAKEAIEAWKRWEESTVEMYQQMCNEEAGCKYWKKLCRRAESEMKAIERLRKQYAK